MKSSSSLGCDLVLLAADASLIHDLDGDRQRIFALTFGYVSLLMGLALMVSSQFFWPQRTARLALVALSKN